MSDFSVRRSIRGVVAAVLAGGGILFVTGMAEAVQGISGIQAGYDSQTRTNDNYSVTGSGSGAFPAGNTYNIAFNSGSNNNLVIQGFEIGTNSYLYIQLSDRINLARVDNVVVTGKHHVLLYEEVNVGNPDIDLKPSYVATMEGSLRSPNVNRGADNVFCNQGDGSGNNNNIERIDYVFLDGYPTRDNLGLRGFLIMDRGGNDAFRVAAITNLNAQGEPVGFSAPVTVLPADWGASGIMIDTLVLRGYTEDGQPLRPSANVGVQTLSGVFVAWQEMGLSTNQIIYGYSLVANDVTDGLDWANPASFPLATDSGSTAGGLDLISGGAMFFNEKLNGEVGDRVWDDWDGDGIQQPWEPGLSNVLVRAYDAQTNLAGVTRTGPDGSYRIRGLSPGDYFLEFVAPSNYLASPADSGGDDALDSDASPSDGRTAAFAVVSGSPDLSRDAGFHLAATDLAVVKTLDDSHPNVGETVHYLVVVTNKGPYSVGGVRVTDLPPTGTVFAASAVSQGAYTASNGVWEVGTLNVGAFATNRITVTIAGGAAGWTITNTAAIDRMNRPDLQPVDNTASAVLTVQITDLAVEKTVDDSSPHEGSNVVFTITVTNQGPDTATGVRLLDLLPAGVSYVSHVAGVGSYSSVDGVWSNFSVLAGGTATLQLTAGVNGGTGGHSITNTATLQALDQVDSEPSNNQAAASLTVRGADLEVVKTVNSAAPNEGDTVTYTILLKNNGPSDASGVTVREALTNGLVYAGHSAGQGSYDNVTGVWTVGGVLAGGEALLTLQATVAGGIMGQSLTNVSRVTASSLPDPVASNNSSEAVVFVSSFGVAKRSSVTFAEPGSNITYTITVTNIGPSAQTGVTVSDPMLQGLTFVPGSIQVSIDPATPDLTNNVRDQFQADAYTNNDGTTNWLGAWQESGESDGATAGNARVTGGAARLRAGVALTRSVELADVTHANLSFSWRETDALDTNNVRDEFSAVSYGNNNGSLNWGGVWQEGGESDGAAAGDALVLGSGVASLRNGRSLNRSVDLSEAQTARLSLVLSQPRTILTNNVRDEFSVVSYANNNGSVNWLGDWLEQGESNGPGSTRVRVTGGYLEIGAANRGVLRGVNLDGYTNAVLSFSYRRVALDNANDNVVLAVTTNGSTWITLATFQGPNNDANFVAYSTNISAYASTNTQIRLLSSGSLGNTDYVYFDNIDITMRGPVYESDDSVSVQVSSNGTSWVSLASFGGALAGPVSTNFDILAYGSANTAIRLATTNYQGEAEVVYVDNVDVTWSRPNLEPDDTVTVRVSTNGVDWVSVVTLADDLGAAWQSTNVSILAYASPNTRVRFETAGYSGANEEFFLDNVDVTFVRGNQPGVAGTAPPTLASGYTLAPGSVLTVSFLATVDNPLLQTAVTNTATVVSTAHPTPKPATVVNPTIYLDLALDKTVDDSNPGEGSNVVFTIVLTNSGPAGATGVVVQDVLPSGMQYSSHLAGQGSFDSGSGLWTVGAIPVGGTVSLTLTATIDSGTAGRTITNTASIVQLLQADALPGNNQDSAVLVVKGADIGVTKTVDNPSPYIRENVTYTIGVTNAGPNEATGVSILDVLTNCLAYVGSVAGQGAYDSGSGVWTIGTLPAGGHVTLQITATVQTNCVGWTVTNAASLATMDQLDPDEGNNRAQATIVPLFPPLEIVKRSSAAGPIDPGGAITYTIAVTNMGGTVQTGVALEDLLPAGLDYVPGSVRLTGPMATNVTFRDEFGSVSYGNNDGTAAWAGDWVESEGDGPGSGNRMVQLDNVRVQTFTLKFAGGNGWIRRGVNLSGYTNAVLSLDYRRESLEALEYVAVAASANGSGGPWVELGRFEGPANDPAHLQASFDLRPYISSNTFIQFVSTNTGMAADDIVWLDDVQILATRWATNTIAGGAPPELASGFILGPGESLVATLAATVPNPPTALDLTNTAAVTSALMSQPKYASVVDVVAQADLEVTKVASTNEVGTNDVVWFTITVTNLGPHRATQVELTDYWPSGIFFSNAWSSAGTYSDASGVWSGFNLNAGQGAMLVITGGMDAAITDMEVTNSVAVTGLRQYDRFPENDRAESALVTLVILSRLEAFRRTDGVRVEWETASEIHTAGFWVQRLTGAGYVNVNRSIVPALPGAPQGGIYRLLDSGVGAGDEVVTYRLVELETSGLRRTYGPFTVSVRPDDGAALLPRSEPRLTPVRDDAVVVGVRTPAALTPPGYGVLGGMVSPLKIGVGQTGVYGLSANSLALAMGVDADTVIQEFAGGNVRLRNRGMEIPWALSDDGTTLWFHGVAADSVYTPHNLYRLTWEPGTPVGVLDTGAPGAAAGVTIFRDVERAEEQVYALTGLRNQPGDDIWLWDYFVADGDDAGPKSWILRTPGAAEGAGMARMTVSLQGATTATRGNDHWAVVLAEGRLVGEVRWPGVGVTNAVFNVPQEWLTDGDVEVRVRAELDAAVPYSTFYLDWMAIEYEREHRAVDGQLELVAGSNALVSVVGFAGSDVRVWDLADAGKPRALAQVAVDAFEGGYRASFVPSAGDAAAVAFEPGAVLPPEWVVVDAPSSLGVPENSARYIVITTADLKPAADRLAVWRSGRGLPAAVVLLDDIYDEFNHGMPDPEAIRDFLKYAGAHWTGRPRYVALAGEGTYDFKDFKETGECRVPPYLVATPDGVIPADDRYADLDDDGVPDLALGRLPAANVNELDRMVDKIIAYESAPAAEWQQRMTRLADRPDAGGNFAASSADLGSRLPAGWVSTSVHLGEVDMATARASLFASLESGAAFLNYFGHGGTSVMGVEGNQHLLDEDDVGALSNSNRLPIVIALTCVIGRFEMPGADCLGEELLLNPGGGGIAVWAPAGMSLNASAGALAKAFYEEMFTGGRGVLGDAILAAKRRYAAESRDPRLLDFFNLLGDPALVLGGFDAEYPGADDEGRNLSFAEWKRTVFGWADQQDPEIAGEQADPDGDGLVNILEYAFGKGARTVDGEALLRVNTLGDGGEYDLSVVFRRHRAAGDIVFHVDVSADLVTWHSDAEHVPQSVATDDGNGTTETVRVFVRTPDPEKRVVYVRLRTWKK